MSWGEERWGRVVVVDFWGERGRGGVGLEERRGGEGVGGMESESEISSTTGRGVVRRWGLVGALDFFDVVAGRILGDDASVEVFRGRSRGFLGEGPWGSLVSAVTGNMPALVAFAFTFVLSDLSC